MTDLIATLKAKAQEVAAMNQMPLRVTLEWLAAEALEEAQRDLKDALDLADYYQTLPAFETAL